MPLVTTTLAIAAIAHGGAGATVLSRILSRTRSSSSSSSAAAAAAAGAADESKRDLAAVRRRGGDAAVARPDRPPQTRR